MGTSFTKLRTFFYKVFFIINTLSSALHEMLYAHHIKLFTEALELFMHIAFQLTVILKIASVEYCLQGAEYMEVRGCKVGNVGRMKENKFKVQTSAGKVMAFIFWESEGILLVEFGNRGASFNSE